MKAYTKKIAEENVNQTEQELDELIEVIKLHIAFLQHQFEGMSDEQIQKLLDFHFKVLEHYGIKADE